METLHGRHPMRQGLQMWMAGYVSAVYRVDIRSIGVHLPKGSVGESGIQVTDVVEVLDSESTRPKSPTAAMTISRIWLLSGFPLNFC